MSDTCKVWTRFESKKRDGTSIKLRIQSWKLKPQDAVFDLVMKHFVPEEAIHKAAGISKSPEAFQEYSELMTHFFKVAPLHTIVCCVDNESNTVDQIVGLSIAQLMKNTDKLEDIVNDMEFKSEEMQQLLHAAKVLEGYLKEKASCYETYYFGRGIFVHPEYRKMGIANELIKVKKLICIDNNVPMTCAGMSAVGTQRAAEKNNWKTFSDISIEELEEETGLTFGDDAISKHKLMYTTIN
ncbi:jg18992 [Pararge aegeria aegeria]|uniref:Jg18992 protein n=2 Tax=Pararge aegeria TaxID=116150 RepID=A0A8S4RDX2_9NEOP|nr:jg18992 [Pararge aegeria aegeria]